MKRSLFISPLVVLFSLFFAKLSLAQPAVSLSPTDLSFGDIATGSTSAPLALTLTNSGNADLHLGAITMGGNQSDGFDVVTDLCSNQVVGAGESCELSVTFAPDVAGGFSGSLTIPSDASSSPEIVALSGTGTETGVSFSPIDLQFGNVALSVATAPATVTFTNSTGTSINVGTLSVAGTNAANFTLGNDTCSNTTVTNSDTCTFTIVFTPNSIGAFSAEVNVPSNASGSPHILELSGTGVANAPIVSLSSATVDFGPQALNTTSNVKIVTVTNVGPAALNISSAVLAGADLSSFEIFANNCDGASLAQNEACSVALTFVPDAAGALSGLLSIASNAVSTPNLVVLTGTGVGVDGPVVNLDPVSLDFGEVNKHASEVETVTLTNSGTLGLEVGQITVAGEDDFAFEVLGDNCSNSSVAVGDSCTFNVKFSSNSRGTFTANVVIPSNAATTPDGLPVSGTATGDGGCALTEGAAPSNALLLCLGLSVLPYFLVRRLFH